MVMAENETGDDHEEVKSPWKTPVIDGEKVADAPVMGTQSWPDLGGTEQTPDDPQVAADGSAPASSAEQGAAGQKSNGSGETNASHKHPSARHQKSSSKRNPTAGPRFPIMLPYYQPPMPPVFHAMVPPPHIAVPGYGYQPAPVPFPAFEPQLVKSSEHAFGPPVQGIDASKNMQPSPRGDPNAYPAKFSSRRPKMQEPSGHLSPGWNHQRAYNPREPIPLQQGTGPRPFARPPFFGPAPGFMVGPNFPGAVCYVPIGPPGSIRGPHPPHFVPYPINSGPAMFPPETVTLRANIVKQIEYYFSDENLQNDHYLISLMDDQGWVPISTIADFKRVKRMSTDIQFILDALLSSSTVEVQGDNIRRRDEWSKWIPAISKTTLSSEAQATQYDLAENVTRSCVNGDVNGDNSRDTSEENIKSPLNSGCMEHVSPESNPAEITCKSNRKHGAVLNDVDQSQEAESVRCINHRTDDVGLLPDIMIQNVADLSNDFTHTFMLDEELELEQKTSIALSAFNRMDDEDDDMVINDQDVQRLVIVTQNKGTGEGSKASPKDSKSIPIELAAVINDGLYFYEQELKAKRFSRRKNYSVYENKDVNSRSPRGASGVSNLKTGENSAGSTNEESGGVISRRKQNKGFFKQQSFHKQRFFSSNLKNHGTGRNSIAIISESPPSNSVGYFFGSTPPDSHGLVLVDIYSF
ncbi:hypothetical protein PTKIN_Ptkin03bG0022200 [Pterospermum kingtungense]